MSSFHFVCQTFTHLERRLLLGSKHARVVWHDFAVLATPLVDRVHRNVTRRLVVMKRILQLGPVHTHVDASKRRMAAFGSNLQITDGGPT